MFRPALLAFGLLAGCATAPAPKMGWAEAGFDPGEAEENAASPAVDAEELARRQKLGPLAVSILRFGGVERAIRAQSHGAPMPEDAVRAWSGLFSAIDQALAGEVRATPQELLRARVAADAELEQDRRAYRTLPSGFEPSVAARLQALSAKLQHTGATRLSRELLRWPLQPATITSLYGPRLDPLDHQSWKRHEGIDLAADQGELVMAAARGIVVEAGPRSGYGLLVAVRHPDGTITRYGHLSQLLTRTGLELEPGGAIGLAGATGRATGPHLHFEIWRHGRAVDPLAVLGDPENSPAATHARR